ncbi:MAG: 4-alpha-glucanotransferase [Rhizobiaceae bacterium]
MSQDILKQLAAHFGIVPTYQDLAGIEQPTSRETNLALLRANGLVLENDADIRNAARQVAAEAHERIVPEEIIIAPGEPVRLTLPGRPDWSVELENGERMQGRSDEDLTLPNLPSGLHTFSCGKGSKTQQARLICAPRKAPSLKSVSGIKHIWGINAALYGLSSDRKSGVGNFQMLSQAGEAFAHQGADFIGINPVHATGWHNREVISPYSPTHRGFLNSLHIAVSKVAPISGQTARMIALWDQEKGSIASSKMVDYALHHQNHEPILLALFDDFLKLADKQQTAQFEAFCAQGGVALRRFAEFEHLCGEQGRSKKSDRTNQPRPTSATNTTPITTSASTDHHLLFHAWLQWIAHQQLQQAQSDCLAAGMKLGLYLDLAVGARRDSAEAWGESQAIAEGVSIGAPPDHLSPGGQNWNLAALAPKKLAADNYRTFRNILQQTMRYCGVIRIDHVLGLNRSYWIPDDGSPGGYVKQNFDTLLALVRLEAQRSNTIVVGEDLGLVPSGFRKTMNRQNIYSYGVLQYEKNKQGHIKGASKLRKKSLVCFGTHDTPTLAGYLQSKDIAWWLKLGWVNSGQAEEMRAQRRDELVQILALAGKHCDDAAISFDLMQQTVYEILAASDTAMVSVQLDDIFATIEAQNLPGTIDEHPNWQRLYGCAIEQFKSDSRLAAMGQIMRRHGRGTPVPSENNI